MSEHPSFEEYANVASYPFNYNDELRANEWMNSLGFIWFIPEGTPEKPNPFNGYWLKDGVSVYQQQAVIMCRSVARPRLSQRLMRALSQLRHHKNATTLPKQSLTDSTGGEDE